MDPIRVAVRRGGVVEAIHRVHGVAVQDGAVIAEAGDSGLVAFMRSSSKPLQALPLARARDDLDERDLAIASASHLADPAQLAAVRALLSKAPASEDELECGPEGEPPSRLKHNCSGKHAGHARPLPCEGLAKRGLPARGPPRPAGDARGARRGGGGGGGRDPDRGRRLRRAHLRAAAGTNGTCVRAASTQLDGGDRIAEACARIPT